MATPGCCDYSGYSRADGLASVGPGWATLINQFFDFIEGKPVKVVQVKEKFGGLRIYVADLYDTLEEPRSGLPEDLYPMIDSIERLSFKMCEDCGKPGEPRKGGWIRTLCDEHARA